MLIKKVCRYCQGVRDELNCFGNALLKTLLLLLVFFLLGVAAAIVLCFLAAFFDQGAWKSFCSLVFLGILWVQYKEKC